MARCVILTRPEPESRDLAEELARRGIASVIAPLLAIRPTGTGLGDAAAYVAAVATSGNGVDGLAAATPRRAMPLFAVGGATAERARRLGFAPVFAAAGTGDALVGLIVDRLQAGDGPILWASGDEVRVDLANELGGRGFRVDRLVVYRAEPVEALPEAAARALADGTADAVLFFSPRTAERFATLVGDAGLARRAAALTAHCLSPAVADAARALPWAAIRTAARPTRGDLLATLDDRVADDRIADHRTASDPD